MLALALGRPGRVGPERCVHRRRSHCRCQRTTVSGRTTISAERQSRQEWARNTQNSRSRWRTEGRGTVRLKTANCWRSARFSSATAWCPPQIKASDQSTTTSAASMSDPVVQPTTESTGLVGDLILAKHRAASCHVQYSEQRCVRALSDPPQWAVNAPHRRTSRSSRTETLPVRTRWNTHVPGERTAQLLRLRQRR
jgi:hypothetical protein